MKMSTRWKLFKVRIKVAYCVLFKYEHWFIVSLTTKELINHFKQEELDLQISVCKLQEYNVLSLITCMHDGIDPDELILKKAEFEAKGELIRLTRSRGDKE